MAWNWRGMNKFIISAVNGQSESFQFTHRRKAKITRFVYSVRDLINSKHIFFTVKQFRFTASLAVRGNSHLRRPNRRTFPIAMLNTA
jgi:hypothetical protein